MRKKYDEQFRAGAIALAEKLGSVSDAAKELGVGEGMIYAWRKKVNSRPAAKPKTRRKLHRHDASAQAVCPTCGAPVRLRFYNGKEA